MADDSSSTSPSKVPRRRFWNRERLLMIGTAVLMTIALPISIDQGYFRYNAYVLPILGLVAASLYIVFLLTMPAVKEYGRQIHAVNRRIGKCLGILLLVILLCCLTEGFHVALDKSKTYVEEAHKADAATRVIQGAPHPPMNLTSTPPATMATSPNANPLANKHEEKSSPQKPNNFSPVVTPQPLGQTPTVQVQTSPPSPPAGSIVQSNSGGVNVQQGTTGGNSPIINSPIVVGDVPRRISQVDMIQITNALRGFPNKCKVKIRAEQLGNTGPFANDLYKAFKDAGWDMADTGVEGFMVVGVPMKAAKADVNENGETIQQINSLTFQAGSPFTFIAQIILSLGLHVDVQRGKDIAPGLVVISFSGRFNI